VRVCGDAAQARVARRARGASHAPHSVLFEPPLRRSRHPTRPPPPPHTHNTPPTQLYLNYKLQSVAHLPWRQMTYKFLNTIIDDLFAFVIKMPTLHRLSVFRCVRVCVCVCVCVCVWLGLRVCAWLGLQGRVRCGRCVGWRRACGAANAPHQP
jgi:hypothetical protein